MVLIKPCKTTAAYEAIPDREARLDLDGLERRLVAAGWETVANARVMLIVARAQEATIFSSGKVLIKTMDRATAERIWADLAPHLEQEGLAVGS